jgi:hypothetical protein
MDSLTDTGAIRHGELADTEKENIGMACPSVKVDHAEQIPFGSESPLLPPVGTQFLKIAVKTHG